MSKNPKTPLVAPKTPRGSKMLLVTSEDTTMSSVTPMCSSPSSQRRFQISCLKIIRNFYLLPFKSPKNEAGAVIQLYVPASYVLQLNDSVVRASLLLQLNDSRGQTATVQKSLKLRPSNQKRIYEKIPWRFQDSPTKSGGVEEIIESKVLRRCCEE